MRMGPGLEVTLTRTEGQIFRERVGFLILCVVGVYCSMRILIELKSILEPFLWALFLVMAWKPVVDTLEKRLEWALGMAPCCWLHDGEENARSKDYMGDELESLAGAEGAGELEQMLDTDSEASPIGRSVYPRDDDILGSGARSRRSASAGPSFHEMDGDDDDLLEGKAKLRRTMARTLAVLIVFAMTLAILSGFGFLILESARHVRDHWDVYRKGAQNLTNETLRVMGYLFQKMPENMKTRYENVTADVMKTAQDFVYGILGDIVNNVSSLLLGGLMTMLYTLFWLCSPVPIHASVDIMFRRYIMFKTLACFGFGICVGVLLSLLSIDLASFFALTTFALNYVPEVGPFLAMLLPCPVILLDSRLDRPMLVMITAVLGQLALKFAFGNIIEVKLIESDKKLRMHPVMILVSVGIFGYLWGPTGMLLSVPLMALLKISLFSDLVPSSYRDPILVLLEGDRNAPMRHALLPSHPRPAA